MQTESSRCHRRRRRRAGSLLVERFLANGDTVVAADAVAEGLKPLAGPTERDGRLLTHVADIASEGDVQGLADVVEQQLGRFDVLKNRAGFVPYVPFEDMSAEMFRRVLGVNLRVPAAHEGHGLGPDRELRLGFRLCRAWLQLAMPLTLRPRPGSWVSRAR